ncbi:hypothetical protein CNYM01_12112 [Colletotrichum nymphaeae SA-01]|uniref:Uncharacterized protein n=1 Tax=Colletotrichum nymphaeae SA-01 TaxID=1460502 RepID=A0A135SQJ9_9PEZI|nr:hypothetical protein CNYM01_12112 [Colletotrichum nymphaeae SA-01]
MGESFCSSACYPGWLKACERGIFEGNALAWNENLSCKVSFWQLTSSSGADNTINHHGPDLDLDPDAKGTA